MVKGQSIGTITDIDGRFVLRIHLHIALQIHLVHIIHKQIICLFFYFTDYLAMEGKNIMLMSKAKDGEAAQQANKVTGIEKHTRYK